MADDEQQQPPPEMPPPLDVTEPEPEPEEPPPPQLPEVDPQADNIQTQIDTLLARVTLESMAEIAKARVDHVGQKLISFWANGGQVPSSMTIHTPCDKEVMAVGAAITSALMFERNAILRRVNAWLETLREEDEEVIDTHAFAVAVLEAISDDIRARGPVVRPPQWTTQSFRRKVADADFRGGKE